MNAPEDLNGWFGFVTVPPVPMFRRVSLEKMCVVVGCYTGDAAKAGDVFKPIRAFSPPAMDFAAEFRSRSSRVCSTAVPEGSAVVLEGRLLS